MQLTWSGFSRISARCDWKIINRTFAWGTELVFSILSPYSLSLSLRILFPKFITSWSTTSTLSHPVQPHSCRPVETWGKTPRLERRARSLCVLQGRWDKLPSMTDNQQTSKWGPCFNFIFQNWNFQRLVTAVKIVFQKAEVNTLGQVNVLFYNPDSAVFTLKASEKAGAGTAVARVKWTFMI